MSRENSKKIKSKNVQRIPSTWIPYKNRWGNWCWHEPKSIADLNWPGLKAPVWVVCPVYENNAWYWHGVS